MKKKNCLDTRFINGDDWVITEGLSMESETELFLRMNEECIRFVQ